MENHHGGDARGGASTKGWVAGWLDWTTSADNTDYLFITDERWAKLGKYSNKARGLYKCPADKFLSGVQRNAKFKERVRSISMNSCMGNGNAKDWYGTDSTIYKKITDMKKLPPVRAWVTVDEQPDSMNDGCFFVNMSSALTWVDMPASYHNGACGFSFADGHSEIKKWVENETKKPITYLEFARITLRSSRDLDWLKERTSEPK